MIYNYDTYNENKIPTDTISSPNIFLEDLIIFNRDMYSQIRGIETGPTRPEKQMIR